VGKQLEFMETTNGSFHVRVSLHEEENGGFVPGAYYVFSSARSGASAIHEVMTFRRDDRVPIPMSQIEFVNDQIGFVYMGWMYAVSTDGGDTWSVWDARKDLPNWKCCNYGLISAVAVKTDGNGVMTLNSIKGRLGEVPELRTRDWGRHWSASGN
jgi:hypothetical protein